MPEEDKTLVTLRGNDGEVLEIERCSFPPPPAPYDEDLLLNVTVVVGEYSAADQSWVVLDAWRGFLSQLRQLEKLRQGEAILEGASPRDLMLCFKATDRLGHMAVSGFLGWERPDGFLQKLEFGFGFDPGMLETLVREFEKLERQG